MITTKKCSLCKKEKPPQDFHNNKSRKDGLASWCKECQRAKMAVLRKTDYYKITRKQYLESEQGKKSVEKTYAKQRKFFRLKKANARKKKMVYSVIMESL